MFTGLVETQAKVLRWDPSATTEMRTMELQRPDGFDSRHGDSIAVNGCCLTECRDQSDRLVFEVSKETIDRTNFSNLKLGATVNLERAMKLSDRLGGHLVSGHVDGICKLLSIEKDSQGWSLRIGLPSSAAPLLIEKGSICLDGVSLTVNSVTDEDCGPVIELMLIPTTVSKTTFGLKTVGDTINFELDMIGKYALRSHQLSPGTTNKEG